MELIHKRGWFSAPTAGNLIIAWVVGIGGGDILIWAGMNVFPDHMRPFKLSAMIGMLLVAVAVWRRWYPGEIPVFSPNKWWLGPIILMVFVLHPVLGRGIPSIEPVWSYPALIAFFWCIVLIGFTEELWWRGIWFEIWKGRPVMCIPVGSIVFTAYHYPFQGFEPLIIIFFFGLVFAAARYKGASIGVLALAHGAIDWVQGMNIIRWQWQTSPLSQNITVPVVSLALMAIIFRREIWETSRRCCSRSKLHPSLR